MPLETFKPMHCENCGNNLFTITPFYYRWNDKEFLLKKCKKCSLIALDPQPTSEELIMLYADDYFETGQHGLNQTAQTYEENKDALSMEARATAIKKTISYNFKTGYKKMYLKLDFAMGHSFGCGKKPWGLEVFRYRVFRRLQYKKAKNKFNIDAICGNFEDLDTTPYLNKWDCIYGGDVFEHFGQPTKVVKNMFAMLADGGIAVVIVPSTFNLFSTYFAILFYRITGKRKKFYDNPYHLFEYTPKTITSIFNKYFDDVQVVNRIKKPAELNMKGGGIEYTIKKMIHYINYPFTKLFNRNGDRLLVVARKSGSKK
jgi:predicted SAM-dependent methyltransferase